MNRTARVTRTTFVVTGLAAVVAFTGCSAPTGPAATPTAASTPVASAPESARPTTMSSPATAGSPATPSATSSPAGVVLVDAETFRFEKNHLLVNAAEDVHCGVVNHPDGQQVVGCQTTFPIPDQVACTRGMPLFEFRTGKDADVTCTDDAMFINPNASSAVPADGQAVTIGTTTFTAEDGGISLAGAPLTGGLHLSRDKGAQWAG